jgi:hypothetical protein
MFLRARIKNPAEAGLYSQFTDERSERDALVLIVLVLIAMIADRMRGL